MPSITLTSDRQATLPRELCQELGVHPGDRLDVDRAVVGGKPVWILRAHRVDWSWIGTARVPEGIAHDMDVIRTSIDRGITQERK